MVPKSTHLPDAWSALRRHTEARIALGRAGGSVPTAELLDFAVAHAAARDAVHAILDIDALRENLGRLSLPCLILKTQAGDRETYLKRPDLGRRLDETSRAALTGGVTAGDEPDVALIVADGLSAPAAQRQAPALLLELVPKLQSAGVRIAPLCIVCQARVAIEDEIGAALNAKLAVILIGERPGLVSAESLGAYLVFSPRPGRTDADRNCISNIRAGGLSPASAAETICYLISESLHRRVSGVLLKDDRPHPLTGPERPAIQHSAGP